MANEHGTPVAYFDMNALTGVPLNRVHNMLQEVRRRLGASRCHIDITEAHSDGQYFITFHHRDAADLFERLYRQTGRTPRRLSEPPDGVLIVNLDEIVLGAILGSVGAFIQRMQARWN